MKSKLNFKRTILNSLIALFVLSASSELIAQQKQSTNLKNFKIVLEKTKNGVKMQCIQGSSWHNLWFSLNNDRPQAN